MGIKELTLRHLATLVPQAPTALTHTGGELGYGVGKVTLIVFVVDVPVAPGGIVQLYVNPATAGTVYVFVLPGQIFVGPVVKSAGTVGFFEMLIHLGALVDEPPQARAAVTQSCPETNAGGKVTLTFVVP